MSHPRATWRGVTVCAHMIPKLDAWARNVGDDIKLTPLPGCGSYQTTTAASAGTHAGGGAIDIDLRGYTEEQRLRVETEGRKVLNLAYYRPAINGLWTWHAHALDASCPELARPAAAQFTLYSRGLNALANNGPDTGSRAFVIQTMAVFAQRLVQQAADSIIAAAGASTYTVRPGDTLGKIAAAYKVTVAQLVSWNGIKDANAISVGQVIKVKAPEAPKPATQAKKPAPAKFVPIKGQDTIYTGNLRPGVTNSTSVYLFQKALIRYLNKYAYKYIPSGADGIYGSETIAALQAVYRDLGMAYKGVTWPGTQLLNKLGLKHRPGKG